MQIQELFEASRIVCVCIHSLVLVWQELKPSSRTCKFELEIRWSEESRVHFLPQGDNLDELMDLKQMDDRLLKEKNGADDLLPALTSLEAKRT